MSPVGGIKLPDPPHVWTLDEIRALPEFGASNGMGWFYGIVREEYDDAEWADAYRLVVAEILPGMGYSTADPPDAEEWSQMRRDFANYAPDLLLEQPAEDQT